MNYNNSEFLASYGLSRQLPDSDRPEIVFSGRSNVGKSSLINKLCNRKKLARVSATPGKTATINFYRAGEVRFVDLPGYGFAKVAKGERRRWDELIGGYFGQSRDIRIVFLLVDMRHPPSSDDLTMADYLIDTETPFVVLLTKADKLNKTQRTARLAAFAQEFPCGEEITMIPCSSETGEGVDAVREIIEDLSQPDDEPKNGGE